MKIGALLVTLGMVAISPLLASDLYPDFSNPPDERDTAIRAARQVAQQHNDVAENLYRVILQEHPDCFYAWFDLGVVRVHQGDLDGARKAFDHALTLNPKDEMCLADLGITESDTGHAANAVQHLQAALKQRPDDPTAREYLSQAYEQLGRHEDAAAEEARSTQLRQRRAMFQLQDIEPGDKLPKQG